MSSFYGGKQGRTYNIIKNYSSVREMVQAFNGGGAYTDVNYGQYVIISTIDRNNNQNGLLYRRGFDYSQTYNDTQPDPRSDSYKTGGQYDPEKFNAAFFAWAQNPGGGAIYVGRIAGPAGAVPGIKLETWNDYISHNSPSTVHSVDNHAELQPNTPGYIPASTASSAIFNDNIYIGVANIKDENGNVSNIHMGMDIPYTVFEATVDNNPYEQTGVVQSTVSQDHPFYYKWDFTIPGGKHGTDFDSLAVKKGSAITSTVSVQSEDSYLTYKIRNYDGTAEGSLSDDLGLFPWKMIDNITPITFQSAEDNDIINGRTVVKNLTEISTDLGTLYYIPESANRYLICIREGTNYLTELPETVYIGDILPYQQIIEEHSDCALWRVIEISVQAPPHGLNIDYTYGNDVQIQYPVYDYFYIDDSGNLYVKRIQNDTEYYDFISTIDSIIGADINHEAGLITIDFISGKTQSFPFKTIERVTFEEDKLKSQQFSVIYNSNENSLSQKIEGSFNTILALGLKGDLLVALYSDPEYRSQATNNYNPNTKNKDWFYLDWTDPVTEIQYDTPQGVTPQDENHRHQLAWIKLSSSSGQYHISKVLDSFLPLEANGEYQNGLGEGREGWLVQVNYEINGQPYRGLYAYDENEATHILPDGSESRWFEVVSLLESVVANPKDHLLISEEQDGTPVQNDYDLKTNGIWFVVSGGHD